MKALFLSNDPSIFEDGSPARARMRAYARAIGELHIISSSKKRSEEHEEGLHLYGIAAGKFRRVLMMRKRARALIREKGIEVISAQDPFEHGFAAMKAAKGTDAALHIQVHTDFLSPWFVRSGVFRSPQIRMPFLNRIRLRLADTVLPQASGIRAVSKRVKDSLAERYGDRVPEASVIPIAVPGELPPPVALPPHPYKFVFFAVSRLEPEKRVEDLLVALARIAQSYPSIGLMIAGDGRGRKKLERLARKLGIASRVMFLGWRNDAWGLLRSANAFMQASAYEGYGLSLIEAALAQVPIITTDVGIVGEVFKGYDDVLAAPPGDPAALATHMRGILEDVQARQVFVMNAARAARAHLAESADQPARIAADLARACQDRRS